ncbi:MAG: exodeoxyribonuclease VII small subunit [Clostridia bacterium]|nr:exodeoxyribonuclease VII small subunit [Clostridia bacterium]
MANINYEKSVARLEEITEKLENGNLPLEEMIKLYEEGTALAAKCAKVLDAAQLKITELSAGKANDDE